MKRHAVVPIAQLGDAARFVAVWQRTSGALSFRAGASEDSALQDLQGAMENGAEFGFVAKLERFIQLVDDDVVEPPATSDRFELTPAGRAALLVAAAFDDERQGATPPHDEEAAV